MARASHTLAILQKELASVREAISDITAGAKSGSMSAGGASQSYTNLDLPTLYAREKELLRRIAALEQRMRGGNGITETRARYG